MIVHIHSVKFKYRTDPSLALIITVHSAVHQFYKLKSYIHLTLRLSMMTNNGLDLFTALYKMLFIMQ